MTGLGLVVGRRQLAMPAPSNRVPPGSPAPWQIRQLSNRLVALVGTPKTDNKPVARFDGRITEYLPVAIGVVTDAQDRKPLPKYPHSRDRDGVRGICERPLRIGEVMRMDGDGVHEA